MTTHLDRPGVLTPRAGFAGQRFRMFVMDELAADYERRHDDVVRLTLGKSELPPRDEILHAMADAATTFAKNNLVHPVGLPALRERLAAEHSCATREIAPDNVIVSVGTSTLFRNIFQILLGPGDEVVLPLPYYPLYLVCAELAGATVRYYQVDPASQEVDLDSLRDAVTDRTRIVVLNSPGNPLGNVLDEPGLRAVDEVVDGRAVLLCDEMYANVVFDGPCGRVVSLPDLASPAVMTTGFSKGYRMYARRVGYAVVPGELVQPLTVLQDHTLLTTDPVPQFGALAALDHPEDVDVLTDRYRQRRDHTVQVFGRTPGLVPYRPEGGFYFTVGVADLLAAGGHDSGLSLAQDIMRETHVATVPGEDFGLPGTLRLSFTATRYNEAIDRIAGYAAARLGGA